MQSVKPNETASLPLFRKSRCCVNFNLRMESALPGGQAIASGMQYGKVVPLHVRSVRCRVRQGGDDMIVARPIRRVSIMSRT